MVLRDPDAERSDEFSQRFYEFARSYPFTPQGEQRIERYGAERAAAARHWQAIRSLVANGEDATDAILRGLLPYANTATNRAGAVWIAHASALTKDVRERFERAGWARADDWPTIAAALLRFVQQCSEDPAQLATYCATLLQAAPVKGFQSGMLSPILNALRPDAFVIFNAASRRVINYFAATTYSLALSDYPAANATARALIASYHEVLARRSGMLLDDGDTFDLFAHWLVAVKRWHFGDRRAWRFAITSAQWEDWRREGAIMIAAPGVGDLSLLSRAEFQAQLAMPSATQLRANPARQQAVALAYDLRDQDQIVLHEGSHMVLGLGVVAGPYYYVSGSPAPHRVPVRWYAGTAYNLERSLWHTPFGRVDATTYAPIATHFVASPASGAAGLRETPAPYTTIGAGPTAGQGERYDLARCAAETGVERATLAQWLRAIDRKGQAILYGPPGTGKTYLAQRLARLLVSDAGFVELLQFHAAYAYEDFIQGLRPQRDSQGNLTYALVPGHLPAFCARARQVSGCCVLIIDEINRANLARVFGEAIVLLEYRDQTLPLAAGGELQIPANVRIIGTMNTSDRSIAPIDHALRRRFAFFPLGPNYDLLRRYHERTGFAVGGLIKVLQQINRTLDDRASAIGMSYFLRPDLAVQIEDIWRFEIEPYLENIFMDREERIDALRWDVVRSSILPPRKQRSGEQ